jgi:GTPase SAR1 family protein
MQEIPFVWIDGLASAGKTTLIERLLQSNRKRDFVVVRLLASDNVSETRSDGGESPECMRYGNAGSTAALRLDYPFMHLPKDENEAMEWVRCLAWRDWGGEESACDALVCEGENDFHWRSQLRVFVARPLPEGQSLITKRRGKRFSLELEDCLPLVHSLAGPPPEAIVDEPAWTDAQASDDFSEPVGRIMEMAKNRLPVYRNVWEISPEYKNITNAAVIVINIHDEKERAAALQLVQEIRRLRDDRAVAHDVFSYHDYRGKVSIYVCNFSNPSDKELSKALTRIKRSIQEFCPRSFYGLAYV